MMKYSSEAETRKHIATVGIFLSRIIASLLNRAILHDESKLEEPEKSAFDKYTPKLKNTTYGSKKYMKFLSDMRPALEHHYDNTLHHPEHWFRANNSGFTGMTGLNDMSLIDIIEMLCDWKEATLRHKDGNIKQSITHNQKRFGYSDELRDIFLNTVDYL